MRIKLISNDTEKSILIKKELNSLFNEYIVEKEPFDYVIAIGGDGQFINTVKETKYSDAIYLGVNTGHLGFLQEIGCEDLVELKEILLNKKYKIEEINLLETHVVSYSDEYFFYSLNEICIKEKNSKVIHMNVLIDGQKLEKFSGDGMIVSTASGSTAYNKSANGSIIFPGIEVIQMTPICPLISSEYRSLNNSVVLSKEHNLRFDVNHYHKDDINIINDGHSLFFKDIKSINCKLSDSKIKLLKLNNYSFWEKINSKFL